MVLDAFGVVMEIEDGGSPKEDQGPITRIRRTDMGSRNTCPSECLTQHTDTRKR